MVAISRISAPVVYVASIAIHLSGILLLLQYLYIRGSSSQNESTSPPNMREIDDIHLLQTRNTNRQSTTSNHSTQSDGFTRKRRRPHSTYGGGGDYLRRESSNLSWDSLPGTLVDRTASGRKIPPRSPSMRFDSTTAERPRTAEPPKIGDKTQAEAIGTPLRRWKSYSGDVHPSMMNEQPRVPLKQETLEEEGESETPRPTTSSSRKLRRRVDHIPSKPDLTELFGENIVVTPEPPRDSLEALSKRESPSQLSGPVLLPPLLDPMISRSALQRQEAASRPSSSKGISESSSSKPRPPSNTLSLQPDGSTTISPRTSEFVFPFQAPTETSSDNEEEPVQSTSQNDTPVSGYLANLIQQPYSWSVNIEDLLQPDPPFLSEDHIYLGSPTSESRLSTITEEGTVRSVYTPPNVIISDTPTPRGSPSVMMRTITPLSANTTNWYAQGGAQDDVDRTMDQFRKTPSPPEVGEQKE